MTIFLFSMALTIAAHQPPWGNGGLRQLPTGAWDGALLRPDGERRLKAFVRSQPSRQVLEATLARAHFMKEEGPGRCVLWHRSAMRSPLTGGVAASVKLCPDTATRVRFFALPPF